MAKSRRGISFRDYIEKRKKEDAAFADGYDEGFHKFKMGVMLKMARKDAKMTQADVAEKMGTTASVISRLEKQSEDMMASTLYKFVVAVGRDLKIT